MTDAPGDRIEELTPDDITEILEIFGSSELEELRIEVGQTRLYVSKHATGALAPSAQSGQGAAAAAPSAQALSSTAGGDAARGPSGQPPPSASAEGASPARPASPDVPSVTGRTDLFELRSPLLGVFYRRPAPGQAPFVEVGATVEPDAPVCIIDVMKMFTRVPAGIAGTVVEVVAEDGKLVEHDQVLMRIEPR